MEITTVADDMLVAHDGTAVTRRDDLRPATPYTVGDVEVRTLPRPGPLVCRFATVNDVHFGETECGSLDGSDLGPIVRPPAGAEPYPETMNRAAAAEIDAIAPAAVIVKGDLSQDGTPQEWAAFEACYRTRFGDRLHVVRGNHDAFHGQTAYAGDEWIGLPGVAVALLDTVRPGLDTGAITADQLDWLDANAAAATTPVIVMGHHQQWVGGARNDDYFGLHPDSSEGLTAVIARRPAIIAYTAGHTHRHRVRMLACGVPTIEIGCVKDFPGTWAEYRVHEGGVLQVVHRISDPAALEWSEQCRHLYRDFGVDYQAYALGHLDDRCRLIELRSGA